MSIPRRSTVIMDLGGNGLQERRALALRLEEERLEERRRRMAQQVAPLEPPTTRIRVWEELHELDLPRSSTHPLLTIIARQTALTIAQVREEQERRSGQVMQGQR